MSGEAGFSRMTGRPLYDTLAAHLVGPVVGHAPPPESEDAPALR